MSCSSVAAASVLAKTTRDAIMVELAREHPAYGLEINKGYASPEHLEALGPTARACSTAAAGRSRAAYADLRALAALEVDRTRRAGTSLKS